VDFEQIVNFRDVGGLRTGDGQQVRHGVLYRSGHLADATEADLTVLAALGIKVVVDLRRDQDIAHEGHNRVPDGTTVVSVPIGDFDTHAGVNLREVLGSRDPERMKAAFPPGGAYEMMVKAARANVLDETHRTRYGEMLRAVIGADGSPVLVNCSAGKDRTGWSVATLLLSVGVPLDDVVEDYLKSNAAVERRLAAMEHLRGGGFEPEVLVPLLGVHADYIGTALAAADEVYGSFANYLDAGLGVSPAELDRLRAHLLETVPAGGGAAR
jgi:protein-tyrosine phosphatase